MNGVGYVQSIEQKNGRTGQFLVAMIQMEGISNPYNMAFFGNSAENNLWDALNKRIEVEYTEVSKGNFTNRAIQSFKVLSESLQPPMPAAQPQGTPGRTATSYTPPVIDNRQENINRQSAYKEAVSLIGIAVENGYNLVQGSGKEAKAAAKDPEVLFELVQYMARRIKDDVQNGTWDMATGVEETSTEDDQELPF